MQNIEIIQQQQEVEEYGPFRTGTGILDDPFVITNISDLDMVKEDLESIYKLACDINAEPTKDWGSALSTQTFFKPIKNFKGIIFGNGHKITNLYTQNGEDPIQVDPCGLLVDLEIEVKTIRKIKIENGIVPSLFGI